MSLPFKIKMELVCQIQETGFLGTAEEYTQQFYNKKIDELTTCEAEMLIRRMKEEPGSLVNTKEGGYGAL